MNELDKLLELAGIIVGAGDFDPRNKKDDAGITIDDMQINHDACDAGNEGHEDNENQLSFSIDNDEYDGYEDLGFGIAGKHGKQTEDGVDEEVQRMYKLAGLDEAEYQAPTTQHIGGGSKQFEQDLARFVSIAQEKGMNNIRDIKAFADKIINKQGIQAFDGVHSEYVAKAAMEKMGVTESEEEYNTDEDEYGDEETPNFPKVDTRDAKPEPDFAKKYDDWYWDGKGDKTFAEEDDLSNGYGKEETFDKDGMFPNGSGSPVIGNKGPSRQGDNPMNWRNKMAVKESISRSLYQELINFKKKD